MRPSVTPAVLGPAMIQENEEVGSVKPEYRGRPRSEESEEAILAATLQLLTEKPLRDISMEEIARKAGVGKATIYKWWPSKAYVALDAYLKYVNRNLPTPDTGSVKKDIQEQLRALMVFYKTPAGRILAQFVAEAHIDKEFAKLFRERFLKPRREQTGIIFDRGVQRGEIDQNVDRELVLDLIFGSGIYRMMIGHAPLDRDVADRILSILFDGLGNRSSDTAGFRRKAAGKRGGARSKAKPPAFAKESGNPLSLV
jgi:AcrR family transcriptional regulator